jgi:hypothetical protein
MKTKYTLTIGISVFLGAIGTIALWYITDEISLKKIGILAGIVIPIIMAIYPIVNWVVALEKVKKIKEYIQTICEEANRKPLPIFISKIIYRNPAKANRFKETLKKEVSADFIEVFNRENIKIEIVDRYISFFKKNETNDIDIEVELFAKYLISRSFDYSAISQEIYNLNMTSTDKVSLFSCLYYAYYKEELKSDFEILFKRANELFKEKNKSTLEQEKVFFEKFPEPDKKKLLLHIVETINKEVPHATYLNNIKSLHDIKESFLIILGETHKQQSREISEKIEKNGGIAIINTRYANVFFYRPKRKYSDINEFLENEILNDIPVDHRCIVFAFRIFPSELSFDSHGEIPDHYNRKLKTIKNIVYSESNIDNLLAIKGLPIIEIIETAPISFFIGNNIRLSTKEKDILARNNVTICNKLREASELEHIDMTLLVNSTEKITLARTLEEVCNIGRQRAAEIASSIKEYISTLRVSLYPREVENDK